MAEDLGLQLHYLEQIVNVQWVGLAVDFGKEAEDAPEPQGSAG